MSQHIPKNRALRLSWCHYYYYYYSWFLCSRSHFTRKRGTSWPRRPPPGWPTCSMPSRWEYRLNTWSNMHSRPCDTQRFTQFIVCNMQYLAVPGCPAAVFGDGLSPWGGPALSTGSLWWVLHGGDDLFLPGRDHTGPPWHALHGICPQVTTDI